MRTFALSLAAAVALLGLTACEPDPADAPPVGEATTATATAPAAVSAAARQADFRLALFDARTQLENAWAACAADDRDCRDRALGTYDATMAEASRVHGLEVDDVVQLQPTGSAASGSSALVQLSGSRG